MRADFLRTVRDFFQDRGFLEVETPLLVPSGTAEPFLDNLELRDPLRPDAPSFLITSPESNLKILLAEVRGPIFQIAHVWRAKDRSPLHTQEFLLLEWYSPEMDEFALMRQIGDLLTHIARTMRMAGTTSLPVSPEPIPVLSIADLMKEHAGCSFERASLEKAAIRLGLVSEAAVREDRYDELFFRVFLDRVEPRLGAPGPVFIHGYPPELAAYSRVENGTGRRFELLWGGVELANGYYEIVDPQEQARRIRDENGIRRATGKPERAPDPELLKALSRGMPEGSGVALGLERLLMVMSGAGRIEEVSPFR